jgi:hypothetical protein
MKINEFYKVGYKYMGKQMWAVLFQMESAQEAMMKMIKRGVEVTGMESDTLEKKQTILEIQKNK